MNHGGITAESRVTSGVPPRRRAAPTIVDMSQKTSDAVDAAIREHIADETGGDVVLGWALVAGVVEHDAPSKTSWLSSRDLADYEIKGLLSEGRELLRARSVHERHRDDER